MAVAKRLCAAGPRLRSRSIATFPLFLFYRRSGPALAVEHFGASPFACWVVFLDPSRSLSPESIFRSSLEARDGLRLSFLREVALVRRVQL